jgi:hypothetical protein
VYKKNLWNLFLTTGDLNFYLEFKRINEEDFSSGEENESNEFDDTQNI